MLGVANLLWYLFIIWLIGIVPPLGIILLVLSLYKDLND
jgi:hypothetical protein